MSIFNKLGIKVKSEESRKMRRDEAITMVALLLGLFGMVVSHAAFPPLEIFGFSGEDTLFFVFLLGGAASGTLLASILRLRGIGLLQMLFPPPIHVYGDDTSTAHEPKAQSYRTAFLRAPLYPLKVEAMFTAGLIFVAIAVFLLSNVKLDTSTATLVQAETTRTWETSQSKKGGDRSYDWHVEFVMPDRVKSTKMDISEQEYQDIVAQRDPINLRIREGYWGVPWVESYNFEIWGERANNPTRGQARTTPTTNTTNTTSPTTIMADNGLREALISWRIPDDEVSYNTDNPRLEKWPSGRIKQSEPTINGLLQGLATYWFDNGRKYGDIPYWQGQKHGRFKLYRDDGTLDQSLSYKNGKAHGLICWYAQDGKSFYAKGLYEDGVYREEISDNLPDCP